MIHRSVGLLMLYVGPSFLSPFSSSCFLFDVAAVLFLHLCVCLSVRSFLSSFNPSFPHRVPLGLSHSPFPYFDVGKGGVKLNLVKVDWS